MSAGICTSLKAAEPWNPELLILCSPEDLSLLYRFTANSRREKEKKLPTPKQIILCLWISTTSYTWGVKIRYLSSNTCTTIWVDGELLDITEFESYGGFDRSNAVLYPLPPPCGEMWENTPNQKNGRLEIKSHQSCEAAHESLRRNQINKTVVK